MLAHGGGGLLAKHVTMHAHRDGYGRQCIGIQPWRGSGRGFLRRCRFSPVESKKQRDEKGHHREEQENQAHSEDGELYSDIE
jgi:hypothetical protein